MELYLALSPPQGRLINGATVPLDTIQIAPAI